ncbi:hypothetical protein HBB16_09510 [Pseudonocardia sp. MCCB 268]|nr:hypothetical protein [Pseudonocardia cytotoxica]
MAEQIETRAAEQAAWGGRDLPGPGGQADRIRTQVEEQVLAESGYYCPRRPTVRPRHRDGSRPAPPADSAPRPGPTARPVPGGEARRLAQHARAEFDTGELTTARATIDQAAVLDPARGENTGVGSRALIDDRLAEQADRAHPVPNRIGSSATAPRPRNASSPASPATYGCAATPTARCGYVPAKRTPGG